MQRPPSSESPGLAWSAADLRGNPHEANDKAVRVQHMFASIARRYDLNNRLHSFGRDQAWRRTAVRLATPTPSDDVLDAACGTGDLSAAFARSGVRSVRGIDFTPAMLDLARRKFASQHPEIVFEHGDITALPCADASFDIVSIGFGLRNVEVPDRALVEFRRVLRPGGRLVVLEFSRPRNPVVRFGNAVYCRYIMPVTATLLARDRSGAYRYLPRSIDTFSSGEALLVAMTRAGFERVHAHPLTFGVCAVSVGHVS